MTASALFTLRRPSEDRIREFLRGQLDAPFSYGCPGMLSGPVPAGFVADRNGTQVGSGLAAYQAACAALRRWEMFRLGWTTLWTDDSEPRPGNVVGILVHRLGVWSLNASRVLRVFAEGAASTARRFGLVYGTLPGHCECGEERFQVELRSDESVHFEILAYSRPCHPVTCGCRPIIRRFQKQFARGALDAMRGAVERG